MTYTLWIEFHPYDILAAEVLFYQWRQLCHLPPSAVIFGSTHPLFPKFHIILRQLDPMIQIVEHSSYHQVMQYSQQHRRSMWYIRAGYLLLQNPMSYISKDDSVTSIFHFDQRSTFFHLKYNNLITSSPSSTMIPQEIQQQVYVELPYPCWNQRQDVPNSVIDMWFETYLRYCRSYVDHHFRDRQMIAYFAPDPVERWSSDENVQHIFTNHMTRNQNIHRLNWIHYFTIYPERGRKMQYLYGKLPGHTRLICCPFHHDRYHAVKSPKDAFYLIKSMNPNILAPIIFDYRTEIFEPHEPALMQYVNRSNVGFTSGIRMLLMLTHFPIQSLFLHNLNLYYPNFSGYVTNPYHNYQLDVRGYKYCVHRCQSNHIQLTIRTNNPNLRLTTKDRLPLTSTPYPSDIAEMQQFYQEPSIDDPDPDPESDPDPNPGSNSIPNQMSVAKATAELEQLQRIRVATQLQLQRDQEMRQKAEQEWQQRLVEARERFQQEQAERAAIEQDGLAKEREERERIIAERVIQIRLAQERIEQERLAKERLAAIAREQMIADQQRLLQEKAEREEQEREARLLAQQVIDQQLDEIRQKIEHEKELIKAQREAHIQSIQQQREAAKLAKKAADKILQQQKMAADRQRQQEQSRQRHLTKEHMKKATQIQQRIQKAQLAHKKAIQRQVQHNANELAIARQTKVDQIRDEVIFRLGMAAATTPSSDPGTGPQPELGPEPEAEPETGPEPEPEVKRLTRRQFRKMMLKQVRRLK